MASEDDVRNWLVNEYESRDMNQLCQALMWQLANRFGSVASTPASAIDAWYASTPGGYGTGGVYGTFTYYDIGTYGHVDWIMTSGNSVMGSTNIVENWGWTNRGWQNPYQYAAITGASILGWAWDNAGNTVPTSGGGGGGGGGTVDYAFGLTTECQAALQSAMNVNGPPYYAGPVDGVFGENSVKGMQQWLKDMGYLPADYVVDGVPGPSYGSALQTLAAERGVPPYTGPIDGAPGENTSWALIGWAQTMTGTDPGPEPGPDLPTTPVGTFFAPDLGTSQETFDFGGFAAAGGQAAILKAGGGNASDSPYVAPAYGTQLAAARTAGVAVGHYWFNGRENGLTPTTSARFFVEHADIQPGDIIALDVEDETATNTAHYTPAEVVEFVDEVARLLPGAKVLIYMNAGDERGSDWTPVVTKGHPLWLASWGANDGSIGTAPTPTHWPEWTLWQYTSMAGPIPGWGSDSLDGNIADDGSWTTYGYEPDDPGPGPDPDPEPGTDAALRELTAAYFGEVAAVNVKYQDLVGELPTAPEAEAGRHRRE